MKHQAREFSEFRPLAPKMPISRDIIPIYDEPPVARYPSSTRMPSVQYLPDGGQNGGTPPGGSGTMGSRRRSWQDLVHESETGTTSDVSVTNYSFGEGSLGTRRQSWMNLMDSEENLHKIGGVRDKVSKNPGVDPKAPKSGMRIVTISDNGRFQKEPNLSQTNSSIIQKSSRASTPSEFILVPKSYPSASSLPRKPPPLADPDIEETDKTHDFGLPVLNRRKTTNSVGAGTYTCPCSAKRALITVLVVAALVAVAVTLGIVLRRNMAWPKSYKLLWWGDQRGQGTVSLTLTVRNEELAVFNVAGWPFAAADTFVDFKNKKVIAIDPALENYCFAMYLNTTALPNVSALVDGAKEIQKQKVIGSSVWLEDWHWRSDILPEQLKETVLSSASDSGCNEKSRILWLDWIYEHQRGQKCEDCHKVCLPIYGIRDGKLNILRRQCFWLYMPEWNQYGNQDEQFRAYYGNKNSNPASSNSNKYGSMDKDDGWLAVNQKNQEGRTLRGQPGTTKRPMGGNGINSENYINNNLRGGESYNNNFRTVDQNGNFDNRNSNFGNAINSNPGTNDNNDGWLPVAISNNN